VGIITAGKGVTIHRKDCDNLEHLQDAPERWLDISWDVSDAPNSPNYVGRIVIIVMSKPHSLGTLSTIIGKHLANIVNLKILHRSTDFYDLLVDVEVKDIGHLNTVVAALRACPLVNSVDRPKG
jgi:GTP pyrophosphokinase